MWLGLPWGVLAFAAEPTVIQQDDHRVRGSIEVDAPIETVRALIADPRTIARIDNSGTTVTLQGKDAHCQLVHSKVVHPIASVEYTTRLCPIADGWQSRLVKSEGMAAFESIWRVQEAGGHVRLVYEIRAIPHIPVPQFVVDRQTRSSVHSLLIKLRDHLESHE